MFRSAGNPIVLGLGTAAVLALGVTYPAWALDDASSSTSQPSGDEASDRVRITFAVTEPVPRGKGFEVKVTVTPLEQPEPTPTPSSSESPSPTPKPEDPLAGMKLVLRAPNVPALTLSRCTVAEPCALATPEDPDAAGDTETILVTIPKSYTPKNLTLIAKVTAEGVEVGSDEETVTVRQPPPPSPTKTSPKPTKTPSKDPGRLDRSPTSGSSGSGGGSSSGSGGSSVSGGVAYTPPAPNGSAATLPPVSLPQAGAPAPTIAPGTAGTTGTVAPQTALRSGTDPVAYRQEFDQLARTQAAWLSALVVAFCLLVAQLRLNRGRTATAAAPARRRKGAHRRR
ncbi:hypothetical protein [Thermomonospora cellulosilytica]|uniref:Uncharacterized protein n=1 Tax=Thermomonospora cellulosilytica TaxID=1411118 RepID=A0A7W3R8R2_9ACTN|nr:hypothetical protein [Thermomonospora cellulosilytica]MBA9003991.1 hypothetical protein [Thermomonospora cellulosilytica]